MTEVSSTTRTLPTEYAAFVHGFGFRFLQPDEPVAGWWARVAVWCKRFGVSFDWWNTRFPPGARGVQAAIKPLCRVPRMSTPAVAALINRGVAGMAPGETFVNVGVWNGFTFLCGIAGNPGQACVGVDNFSQFGGPKDAFLARFQQHKSANHHFFDMDYKDYFTTVHRDPIGFYLYDGDHPYHDQLEGLRRAEPYFGPNCLILVDDTNDPQPRSATLDFMEASRNKYQVLLDAKTCQNQHPTWWNGVMLLQRVG